MGTDNCLPPERRLAAFHAWLVDHHEELTRFALWAAGGDVSLAHEEGLDKAIPYLWKRYAKKGESIPKMSYIKTLIRCRIIDGFRKRQRATPLNESEDFSGVFSLQLDPFNPLEQLLEKERVTARRMLLEELEKLPRSDRGLLKALYFGNLTSAEYARRHGEKPDTIRSRKMRALKALQENLVSRLTGADRHWKEAY